MLALALSGAWLAAHEGHNTAPEQPAYRQVQAGDATYRVGFAMLPRDPLVGEDVRFELQILELSEAQPDAPGRPVASGDLQVRIISTGTTPHTVPYVTAGEQPGTYSARYRFADRGQYAIATSLESSPHTIRADFPIVVGAGPVVRAALAIDAIVLLVIAALAFSLWRRRTRKAAERTAPLGVDAALAAAAMAVLVVAHMWISPRVGRAFLPERHFGPVAWNDGAPGGSEPATAPHTHPEGTPPHSHGEGPAPQSDREGTPPALTTAPGQAAEIVSTVVPVPGQLVDVVVPVTARVLFEEFTPRAGRTVRRGQTIAVLEHHYVLHDANHLINQRWPFLLRVLETRREMLAAELNATRLRYLHETSDPAVKQTMAVMQAVPAAEMAAATARLEQERAEKLLAMHDAQITKGDLVRRPITAPIDGVIEAVSFTQGELKYENDKLFTILDLSRVWIEARFPERDASVPPPRQMTFISPAFPDMRFTGRLVRVANTLDPRTGTVSAFFEVPNPRRLLRLGMRLEGRHAAGDAPTAVAATADTPSRAMALRPAAAVSSAPVSLAATVRAKPELTAEVTAPLWGRLELAGRRLNVGDRVRKGEDLVHVVLELPVGERYPMEARALEIDAERELAKARRARAEQQWRESIDRLKASPEDPFRREEVQLTERIYRAAQQEESLLVRQADVFKDVIKRRDPKITVVQAPISGVVTEVGFRPGELNRTNEFRRLLTIVDTSRVWLEAQLYAHQSGAVLNGFTPASFTSPGLPSPRPLDRPIAVSGAVSPDTGALSVIFDVPNPGGALKVGASAQIVIPRD